MEKILRALKKLEREKRENRLTIEKLKKDEKYQALEDREEKFYYIEKYISGYTLIDGATRTKDDDIAFILNTLHYFKMNEFIT